MSRTVAKYFRIHPVLKQQFERFCGALGLDQSQVLEQLISGWCEEHRDQVRLDVYIPNSGNSIINHPREVNIAIKAELTYCRMELERLVSLCEKRRGEQNYGDFLRDLMKIVLRASKIQQASQDSGLKDLLAKTEAHLG